MILDSSKTKEAVEYCLRRWENLENYINYPEVTFSTNEAERGVKSWVMVKKNFLFAGSGNGARLSTTTVPTCSCLVRSDSRASPSAREKLRAERRQR